MIRVHYAITSSMINSSIHKILSPRYFLSVPFHSPEGPENVFCGVEREIFDMHTSAS